MHPSRGAFVLLTEHDGSKRIYGGKLDEISNPEDAGEARAEKKPGTEPPKEVLADIRPLRAISDRDEPSRNARALHALENPGTAIH